MDAQDQPGTEMSPLQVPHLSSQALQITDAPGRQEDTEVTAAAVCRLLSACLGSVLVDRGTLGAVPLGAECRVSQARVESPSWLCGPILRPVVSTQGARALGVPSAPQPLLSHSSLRGQDANLT